MAFKIYFETHEAEAARLAQSPEGSTNHALAALPVNSIGGIQDLMIELPDLDGDGRKLVVVPTERHPIAKRDYADGELHRRYDFSWTCIVVASTHPSYPVGGWRVSFPESTDK